MKLSSTHHLHTSTLLRRCSDPEALAEGSDPALLGLELVAVPPSAHCVGGAAPVVHDVSFTLPVHLRYHQVMMPWVNHTTTPEPHLSPLSIPPGAHRTG